MATIGNAGVSDISVDDIYIDTGKCPEGLSRKAQKLYVFVSPLLLLHVLRQIRSIY